MSQSNVKAQSGLSLQNPQKMDENAKIFEGQNSTQIKKDENQKRQQDNDYLCEFKLTVKQKFQQKLKVDATDQLFIIIVNEIIEERIKKNYHIQNQQLQSPQITQNINENQEQLKEQNKGPSQLQKMKAEDEEVKRKIKQLMKRRPKKKGLNYELDPNRDKGFILAKKMNQIKQLRQKKYIQTKKQFQQNKKQLKQSQFETINIIQRFSVQLAKKGKRSLRYQNNNQSKSVTLSSNGQYKLPKLVQRNSFFTDIQQKNKNSLFDFLNTSTALNSSNTLNSQRRTLTQRTYSSFKSKQKQRDLQRQIQILRKSQKITQKYQIKKIVYQLIDQIIFTSVKLVQTKKQFFFNQPPKPVHQMIRNYKDKNGKTIWIPGSKPQKIKINIHLSKKIQSRQQKNSPTNSNYSQAKKSKHNLDLQSMKISQYQSQIHRSQVISYENQQQLTKKQPNNKINQRVDVRLDNRKQNLEQQRQKQAERQIDNQSYINQFQDQDANSEDSNGKSQENQDIKQQKNDTVDGSIQQKQVQQANTISFSL